MTERHGELDMTNHQSDRLVQITLQIEPTAQQENVLETLRRSGKAVSFLR